MLELPNPFEGEGGVLRLLEPRGCNRKAIVARVLAGDYPRPFVIEDDGARALYFTRDFVQSEMRLDDPFALEFAYTRKAMAFLLFVPQPRSILLLGLGGGSLAKFCHRHLEAAITAVEIDPDVIAFRDQFLVPPDDGRLRVVQGDAAEHVRTSAVLHDVVMVDAFDRRGVADSLASREFHDDVRRILSRKGVMVANVVGDRAARQAHFEAIRDAFDGNVILLPLAEDGNYLAFAFRDPGFEPRWRWLDREAKALRARYGLDFPKFAGRLERSRKLGYLRRELHGPAARTA